MFSKTEKKLLTTTSPEGVYLGTTLADLTTHYKVQAMHLLGNAASPGEFLLMVEYVISYDAGTTWHAADTLQVPADTAVLSDFASAAEQALQSALEVS